jgi:hypothetical protein
MDNELVRLLELIREHGWALLGVLLPILYVFGAPLLTLFTFRSEANPTFERVGESLSFPDDVERHFEVARAHFARFGFEEVDTLYLPHQMDNVKAILRMFINRPEQDAAMAVAMYGLIGDQWQLQTQYVEMNTEYRDGTVVDTQNGQRIGAFPTPAHKTLTIAPWLTDISELYRAHQAICRFVAHGKTKELKLDTVHQGDIVADLTAGMIDEFEHARAAGYVRYSAARETRSLESNSANPYQSPESAPAIAQYVATFKGAYLMTWNELWPFKAWNRWRHQRRSKRLLAQAGWFSQESN